MSGSLGGRKGCACRKPRDATGGDITIDELPLGSEGMPFPSRVAETCEIDGRLGKSVHHFGDHDHSAARHNVGCRVKGRERLVHRFMNHFVNDHMHLANISTERIELTRVVVAEIVELGMRYG